MITKTNLEEGLHQLFPCEINNVVDAMNDFLRVPTIDNLQNVVEYLEDYQDEFVRYTAAVVQPGKELAS